MKLKILLSALFTAAMTTLSYGACIINVPLDSRPVSNEYLRDLTKISSDEYLSVSKDGLDMYTASGEGNKEGDSKLVRKELRELVEKHNDPDTTVIISTPGYITNGLVAGRTGENYSDAEEALNELESLISDYPLPHYKIDIVMPRVLPETRAGKIWPNDEKSKGLAYFYLNEFPDSPQKEEIEKSYQYVDSVQLLTEYAYVRCKAEEMGEESLLPFEKRFFEYFKNTYSSDEYIDYIEKAELPYKFTAELFENILSIENENVDIVVGIDDVKFPSFIEYGYGKHLFSLPLKDGFPIKFSYSRKYIETDKNSVENVLAAKKGKRELDAALLGNGERVNILSGTDELPQLIYARDCVQRNGVCANLELSFNERRNRVAKFDANNPSKIANICVNFTNAQVKPKTERKFTMLVFDYEGGSPYYIKDMLQRFRSAAENGDNIGLIELFSTEQITRSNVFYRDILDKSELAKTVPSRNGLFELDVYSAWNTNANAIGLGIAQAQVYSVADKKGIPTKKEAVENLYKHLLEDGEYTKNGKRELVGKSFKPQDDKNSQELLSVLNADAVKEALMGGKCDMGGKEYTIEDIKLTNYSFPWLRTFEVLLEDEAVITGA